MRIQAMWFLWCDNLWMGQRNRWSWNGTKCLKFHGDLLAQFIGTIHVILHNESLNQPIYYCSRWTVADFHIFRPITPWSIAWLHFGCREFLLEAVWKLFRTQLKGMYASPCPLTSHQESTDMFNHEGTNQNTICPSLVTVWHETG